ncbi:MAG: substrate-binding domain-containing protein [Opitutus sp.]
MHPVPQRVSLIVQTQEVILDGIRSGRWQGRLPGERKLCKELQVSRWTLRGALTALARQQVIRIAHGQACTVVARGAGRTRRKASSSEWHAGLIMPEPLWRLRPFVALWIDALRAWLQANGGELHLYDGPSYFGKNGDAALARLTKQAPHDCWSLLLSTHAMQLWFKERGLPVVAIGSTFEDVQLPSVDLAYRAVGRHAAGKLLAQGHEQIAWLSSNVTLAGVMECKRGFMEAFALPQHATAELIVCQHAGSAADICRVLDRLRRRTAPPTALYLQQSNALLTTLSHLAQLGLSIPRNVSLIVAEDEPYFRHIVPEIARYSSEPEAFAHRIGRFLKQAMQGTLSEGSEAHIMPTFIAGTTVARHVPMRK